MKNYKVFIDINSPNQIDTNRVKKQIEAFIKSGHLTHEIGLVMHFITDEPDTITAKFRVLKNRAAFDRDMGTL